MSQYRVQSYRSPRCVRRTLADALTARAAPLPPNRSRLERRSVASFCRVRLFAACEVVLRRSAARRLAHAEVRRSHDTSVVTPPLRFAKLCRYRVARSRAAGLRACESVFPPFHSPGERLNAGHREAWPRARACLAVSRHRPSIRGSPRTLATIRPPVAARPPPLARHYCCRKSRCTRAESCLTR